MITRKTEAITSPTRAQFISKASRASPVMVIRFTLEPRLTDKSIVIRQV